MASTSKVKQLCGSDDEDSDPEDFNFDNINEKYAEKFTAWKEKEERKKLEEKFGDVSDLSSSSEDDLEEWNAEFDKEWLRVYSAVKYKDKDIYDENVQFVRGEDEGEDDSEEEEEEEEDSGSSSSESERGPSKKKKKNEDKPLTTRDYVRNFIADRQGVESESKDEKEMEAQAQDPSYHQEQEAIKKSFVKGISDDEDDDLFKCRIKSDKEKEKDNEGYLQFLKGEKEIGDLKSSHDRQIAKEIAPLRNFLSEPSQWDEEGRKLVWETLIVGGPLKEKREDLDEDAVGEEMELIQMEDEDDDFEHTYNFRYEEPDKNFIKQYKRNPEDTVRQEVNKRAQKRKEIKERKKRAEAERREGIRRLKNLKKKEKERQLELIKKEWPAGVDFSLDDLQGDYDPKALDKLIEEKLSKFDEDDISEEEKPAMDDIADNVSIDSYISDDADSGAEGGEWGEHAPSDTDEQQAGPSGSKANSEYEPPWLAEMTKASRRARKKRKSYFQQYREAKMGQEMDEEYDTYEEFGYKYHNVMANDFGIPVQKTLWLPTRELNSWASINAVTRLKTEAEESYDLRKYKSAKMQRKMANILPSLKKIDDESYQYEDIRPSVLRGSKKEEEEESEEEEEEEEDEEIRKRKARIFAEEDGEIRKRKAKISAEEGGEKKKKKAKVLAGEDGVEKKKKAKVLAGEGGVKKKKKVKVLAEDGVEKKKKAKVSAEEDGVKKKKKAKVLAEHTGDHDTAVKTKKKKKKQKSAQEEQGESAVKKDRKKIKTGKKKQKRKDGPPKTKGYIAKDQIEKSRLAAFGIDAVKFKYTKDRIVPVGADG